MDYSYLFHTATGEKWQKTGVSRRAGVVLPLFSIFSRESAGIGEFSDIAHVVDWCKSTGFSMIQLLPLNEMGDDHAPYNAISSFAIDSIYINLNKLKGVRLKDFQHQFKSLKKRFPQRKLRVNFRIKQEKLALLWEIYKCTPISADIEFTEFCNENSYWLDDYALFKVIAEKHGTPLWENWPLLYGERDTEALGDVKTANIERLSFHKWVQWQAYEQLKSAKNYAASYGVKLMGDLPFLVSRVGAEVWSKKHYFKLELSSGAPPDMYFALGQKWGMPPYNWFNIAEDGFIYLKERLRYAGNFYDMFRIDHFVGLFRVWTIPNNSPAEQAAIHGCYDPPAEHFWEEHGKAIINVMLSATSMLPCAEDLGTVPEASYKTLLEFGIPGIDFQRYLKNQGANFAFKHPFDYRACSAAVLSTHDSSFFFNWWKTEAGTMDEKLFEMLMEKQGRNSGEISELKKILFERKLSTGGRLYWNDGISSRELFLSIVRPNQDTENSIAYAYLDSYGEKWKLLEYLGLYNKVPGEATTELIRSALEKINSASSIFSIQPIHEYLALDEQLLNKMNKPTYRINTPGNVNNRNWSQLLPCSLEELKELKINSAITEMLQRTGRIPGA